MCMNLCDMCVDYCMPAPNFITILSCSAVRFVEREKKTEGSDAVGELTAIIITFELFPRLNFYSHAGWLVIVLVLFISFRFVSVWDVFGSVFHILNCIVFNLD